MNLIKLLERISNSCWKAYNLVWFGFGLSLYLSKVIPMVRCSFFCNFLCNSLGYCNLVRHRIYIYIYIHHTKKSSNHFTRPASNLNETNCFECTSWSYVRSNLILFLWYRPERFKAFNTHLSQVSFPGDIS